MEIGTEISQKVRSAIKAKLVDLGAYVDDELPDYIMVMVANRKTKEQMTDDLNLFLGNNTLKFTEWLSVLLDKLQLVANKEEEAKASASETTETEENVPEETPATSANVSGKQPEVTPTQGTEERRKSREHSTEHKKVERTSSVEVGQKRLSGSHISPQATKKQRTSESEGGSAQDKSDSLTQATVVPDIVLAAEKDVQFEEETEQIAKKKGPIVHHMSGVKTTHKTVTTKTEKTSPTKPSKEEVSSKSRSTTSSRVSERSSGISRTTKSESVKSRLGTSSDHTESSSSSSRKRKPLTSAIGAVVIKPSMDVEEEQYDPYRPAIGKVASQVKITERKSKVPTAWQADKSILLKAVNAAQHSTKDSSHKEKATVKPLRHEPEPRKHSRHSHRSSVHHRLRGRSPSPPRRGMHSDRLSSRSTSSRSGTSRREYSSRHESSTGERKIQVITTNSRDDEALSLLRSKVLGRKKEKEAKEERARDRSAEDRKKAKEDLSEKSGEDSESERSENEGSENGSVIQEDAIDISLPEDQRLIEYELEEDELNKLSVPKYKATPISRRMGTLVESGAEDSDFTDGEGEDSRVVRQHERLARLQERPASPKFVVTLDGVDPVLLKTEVKFDVESDNEHDPLPPEDAAPKLERNIVRVEPRPQKPMVQPVTMVNLAEDEEFDGEDSVMTDVSETKPAVAERCRFWPSCKNGEVCPYAHPTEPCRNFPSCKFADKCLYIHPDCKFDASCTKPNCPFTHRNKKPMAPMPQSVPVFVQPIKLPVFSGGFYPPPRAPRPPHPTSKHPSEVTCKFFPQCTNMSCPFYHPKPCRFGLACNNKATCHFSHPKLPTKDQLVWSTKTPQKEANVLPSPAISPITITDGPQHSTPKT